MPSRPATRSVRAGWPPGTWPTPRPISWRATRSRGLSRSHRKPWHGATESRVRTALITGGSGGIGKACGRKLVELGYDVVLTARREGALRAAAEDMGARYV